MTQASAIDTDAFAPAHHLGLAADIVAAYVSNNPLPPAELPKLLHSTHAALTELVIGASAAAAPEVEVEKPSAAQIKKSITPDALISFIDGKPYKVLRRHLTANNLTPEGYRARFGLPVDYPLVAPGYSEKRSALAKDIGLGKPGAQAERATSRKKAA